MSSTDTAQKFEMDARHQNITAIHFPHAITKEDVEDYKLIFGSKIDITGGEKVRPKYKHFIGRTSHEMALYIACAIAPKSGYDIEEGASFDENCKTMSWQKNKNCLLRLYVDEEDPFAIVYREEMEKTLADSKKMDRLITKIGKLDEGFVIGECAETKVADEFSHKRTLMIHSAYWSLPQGVMGWRSIGDSVTVVAWTNTPGEYYHGELVVEDATQDGHPVLDNFGRTMCSYAWEGDHVRYHAPFNWPLGYSQYGEEGEEKTYLYSEKMCGLEGHLRIMKVTKISEEDFRLKRVTTPGGRTPSDKVDLAAMMRAGAARAAARTPTGSESGKTEDAVPTKQGGDAVDERKAKRIPKTPGQIAAEVDVDFKNIDALVLRVNQMLRAEYPEQELMERADMREDIIMMVIKDMAKRRLKLSPEMQTLIGNWQNLSDREKDMGRGWYMRSQMWVRDHILRKKLAVEKAVKKTAEAKKKKSKSSSKGDFFEYPSCDEPSSEEEDENSGSSESEEEEPEPPRKSLKKGILSSAEKTKNKKKETAVKKKKQSGKTMGAIKKVAAFLVPLVAVLAVAGLLFGVVLMFALLMARMYRGALGTAKVLGSMATMAGVFGLFSDEVPVPTPGTLANVWGITKTYVEGVLGSN